MPNIPGHGPGYYLPTTSDDASSRYSPNSSDNTSSHHPAAYSTSSLILPTVMLLPHMGHVSESTSVPHPPYNSNRPSPSRSTLSLSPPATTVVLPRPNHVSESTAIHHPPYNLNRPIPSSTLSLIPPPPTTVVRVAAPNHIFPSTPIHPLPDNSNRPGLSYATPSLPPPGATVVVLPRPNYVSESTAIPHPPYNSNRPGPSYTSYRAQRRHPFGSPKGAQPFVSNGFDEMRISIQEDFGGIEMEHHRVDLIRRLDHVIETLDRGPRYLGQHNPGREHHLWRMKNIYQSLRETLLRVDAEAKALVEAEAEVVRRITGSHTTFMCALPLPCP